MEALAADAIAKTAAPDGSVATLDVREAGPPAPMQDTLERLESMDDAVLVQLNDRVPQFLFPELEDRGYAHETVEREEGAVTVIWREP